MAPDTLSLAGKTALITGSGRENGIGAAIAIAFARNGASVALHYVSEGSKARAEKLAADITRRFGTKTTVVHGQVQEHASAEKIVLQTLEGLQTDHIDILVNNAGYGAAKSLLDVKPEEVEQEFGVNAFSTIYVIQAVVNKGKMPRGGRIINVGSIASKLGMQLSAVYAATKAAQDSLTASWAGELGKTHGITVNSLAPGPIPTDLSGKFLNSSDPATKGLIDGIVAQTRAEARLGTVEDMADAALLLVSEKSRWITAQWISLSGGVTGTM